MFITRNLKYVCIGLVVAGVIKLVAGLVFMFAGQDLLVKSIIKKSVVLKDGSDIWSRFVTLPFPFHFKGYLFDIINANDVLKYGDTPIVNEVGPYYFHEYRAKTLYDLENATDNSVAYREHLFFEYDEELSDGRSLDVNATVINPAFFGILSALESIDANLPFDLEKGVKSMFEEPYAFFSAPIRELMFEGTTICNPNKTDSVGKLLCLILMLIKQKNMVYNEDLSISFSFFGYRNDSSDGLFTVNTGESDISQVGTISTWENSSYTTYWSGSKSACNKVEGSRTTVFPPFLEKGMDFNVFSTDICKSANIVYGNTSSYHDIEGYRFHTYLNSFTSSDDDCYCTDGAKDLDGNDTCFSDGLLNLYTCHAAPILLSYPHFLWLDESLSNTVEGLNASEDIHTTYVDIDPYLGIPLRSTQKVQFNLILRPYLFGNGSYISLTQNLSRALTPFLWVDEGMALTSDITDEMRSQLYDRLKLLNIMEWVIIALGIVFIIVPPAAYGIKKLRATSHVNGVIKK